MYIIAVFYEEKINQDFFKLYFETNEKYQEIYRQFKIGDMSAVFIDYPGTDYCAGLNFGYNGAYFLTRFVTTVNAVKDLQDASNKQAGEDSA